MAIQTLRLEKVHDMEFDAALTLAKDKAGKFFTIPMALSWLDRRKGRHSPDVSCCGNGEKEAWEIYAESRGGTLRVEVGDEYVFIFREGNIIQ
jgi:hypothetical protein